MKYFITFIAYLRHKLIDILAPVRLNLSSSWVFTSYIHFNCFRSTRSFGEIPKGLGDTVVGAIRRSLRWMRDWSMRKSQPKVEFIELSPMSTAPVTPQVKLLLKKV